MPPRKTDQAKKTHRVGELILISYGKLLPEYQNRGLPVSCYICDAAHKASGLARIEDRHATFHVPLCDACLASRDGNAVLRKYWRAPDLKVTEGGKATTKELLAMTAMPDATEH
jgi:hypothetical protein